MCLIVPLDTIRAVIPHVVLVVLVVIHVLLIQLALLVLLLYFIMVFVTVFVLLGRSQVGLPVSNAALDVLIVPPALYALSVLIYTLL